MEEKLNATSTQSDKIKLCQNHMPLEAITIDKEAIQPALVFSEFITAAWKAK